NSPLLEYEEWLVSSYLLVEQHMNHSIPRVREYSSMLLDDLTLSLLEVDNWKMLEWEKQRIIVLHTSEQSKQPNHWLGRLLCRPGLESTLDRGILKTSKKNPMECGDIFDTDTIQMLQGPDGQPFLKTGTNEGRYIFGLCMDGFQPHGRGGPPTSIGAIYLACMNLPPDIRYSLDNLFLAGIIP
ncbi:uncharacterized protein LAESUDRAFT_605410, partial [Laetiporus sulphureus 93-53]